MPSSGWGPRYSRPGPARTPAAKRAKVPASGARTPAQDPGRPREAPQPPGFSRQHRVRALARAPAAAAAPLRCSSWSPWRHAGRGAPAQRGPEGRQPPRTDESGGGLRPRLLWLLSALRPRLVRLRRASQTQAGRSGRCSRLGGGWGAGLGSPLTTPSGTRRNGSGDPKGG